MASLDRAVRAIEDGEVIVYPTETVYGLGADARNEAAVKRVFELKRRGLDSHLSVAVPSIEAVDAVAKPSERTRRFMKAFLPGPVTVVCPRTTSLPDIVTAGRERVGIRIPASPLAIDLLERTRPLTATSANISGADAVRHPDELDERIRNGVAVTIDGGISPGGHSTVVDIDRGEIHRRGELAAEVERWLAEDRGHADSP